MKQSLRYVLCCLSILVLPDAALAQSEDWQTINTDGLKEWSDPGRWWSSEDGVIVAESPGGKSLPKIHHLIWDGVLTGDFELQLEYRIFSKAPQDAGIYFRVHRNIKVNRKNNLTGYQAELDTANLYATNRAQRNGKLFGNIYDGKRSQMRWRGKRVEIDANGKETIQPLAQRFPTLKVFRKPPQWNECLIRTEGDLIQLYLNGRLANELVDRDSKKKSTGDAIALQFRPNGAYRFEVRKLKFRKTGL